MLALEERRSALQDEVDSLVRQLHQLSSHLFDNAAPTANSAAGFHAPDARRHQRRGQLTAKVKAALATAGSAGVKVKDLAAAIGTKPANIHAWFHAAMKRRGDIVKIAGGHYRLGSGSETRTPPRTRSGTARKGRRTRTKRGQLTANIMGELKAAGSKGITVAELATKLGANYRNVYIWFATTGKKFPQIKKAAPATYKLAD